MSRYKTGIILDRWTKLMVFGLGAYSGLMAAGYNAQYIGFIWPLSAKHHGLFLFLAISVIAPIVEESVKPIGLYLLKLTRVRMRAREWIVLGAIAGCGFGIFENTIYGIDVIPHGLHAVVGVMTIRFGLSLPLHMTTTSIAAYGVLQWAKSKDIAKLIKFVLVAAAGHSIYNLLIVIAGGWLP